MKKIVVGMGLLLGSFFVNKSEAQVSVQLNIGGLFSAAISSQPNVVLDDPGYYDQSGYYYYPDINCYYDPTASLYYYMYNGGWMQSNGIPAPYRNYDFNRGRRMMMNQGQMAQRGVRFARGGNMGRQQMGGQQMYGQGMGGQQMGNQQMGGQRMGNNNMQMRDYGNRMAMNNRGQGGDNRGNMNGNFNRGGNERGQMGRGDRMERR